MQKIVDIELKPLLDRINEMGHSLEVSKDARELLGKKGYDMQFGARPLKRAIQDLLEDPLCELLMEPLSNSPKGEDKLQLKAEVDADNKEKITITKQ